MAGDIKETTADETAPPVVNDPFPDIKATLDAIAAAIRGDDMFTYSFGADGFLLAGATWQRLRLRYFVFATDDADTVTLQVGTLARSFTVPAADTRVIPLPLVIERGSDVQVSGSIVEAYLIGTPE